MESYRGKGNDQIKNEYGTGALGELPPKVVIAELGRKLLKEVERERYH